MKITFLFSTLVLIVASLNLATGQSEADQMIADWQRAKAFTLEYLEAMPEEGYAWQPTPSIRSFADQMMHLTDGNYGFASAALGMESPHGQGGHEKMEDKSKEKVIELVAAGYDYVIDGIKNADTAKMGESITLFGQFELTRHQALKKAFEHQTHHRGQATVYLRMAGVKPPQEKLF